MIILSLLIISACTSLRVPNDFKYQEVQTRTFKIATWQKIKNPQQPYRIYIEGDGYAFNAAGRPSSNPTPRSDLVREMAFGDYHDNVIYIARPCQFVQNEICSKRHWTTARFAPEVINATAEVIENIAGDNEVTIIGYSGGAQVAGLVAANKPKIKTKKLITIAGNLDHLAWTQYHKLPPLNESMNLEAYRDEYLKIPQVHFVGEKDDVIPVFLTHDFVQNKHEIIIIPNNTHNRGWKEIYPQVWKK